MNVPMRHDPLIDSLVASLAPVRVIRRREGASLIIASVTACVIAIASVFGLQSGIRALDPSFITVVRSTALLLVGIAAALAVLNAARPGVGGRSQGWVWALAAALIVPLFALLGALKGDAQITDVMSHSVFWCFTISLSGASVIAAAMTMWLRRGAVTEPKRTAWLVGLTAGAFGAFAYNLHCPSTTIYYAGLWYSLAVAVSAIIARITLPPLLRW